MSPGQGPLSPDPTDTGKRRLKTTGLDTGMINLCLDCTTSDCRRRFMWLVYEGIIFIWRSTQEHQGADSSPWYLHSMPISISYITPWHGEKIPSIIPHLKAGQPRQRCITVKTKLHISQLKLTYLVCGAYGYFRERAVYTFKRNQIKNEAPASWSEPLKTRKKRYYFWKQQVLLLLHDQCSFSASENATASEGCLEQFKTHGMNFACLTVKKEKREDHIVTVPTVAPTRHYGTRSGREKWKNLVCLHVSKTRSLNFTEED